jgi:transposase
LQQRLFGSSSERLDPNQLQLELDALTLGKPEPPPQTGGGDESGMEEVDADPKPKRNRRKKADLFPRNLPVIITEVIVPDEVAADPDAYREIGEEYHDELEAERASLYWERQVRKKFVSKTDRSRPPLMEPAPEPSVPGTLCGPNLMAQILVDKYEDHLPHYRQSSRFLRQHQVELRRQTINGWTHAAAAHLSPIGEAIRLTLPEAKVLQIDETPADYLAPGCGKTGQGYLWYYRDAERGTLYCDWQLGRGHECLLDILGLDEENGTTLFSGIIQCDGYSAYRALVARYEGIRLGGCLAHIRRKFFEARQQAPEVVLPILAEIGKLYRIERGLQQSNAPPVCRWLVRRARSRPVVEALHRKILGQREAHLPRSNLGKALNYALNQWEEFLVYLEDGRMEIDNNLIENAIRPAKLGLKNYLFFGSAEAGKTSALIYTLLANCKAEGIDPERYLAVAIKRLPANASLEQAAELTPAKLAPEIRSAQPVPAEESADAEAA